MKINQTMLHILSDLRSTEPRSTRRLLDTPIAQIGHQLIRLYYLTDRYESRQLVIEFMREAGFEWTRKLIMRETDGDVSPVRFTGLTEYTRLAAANDPSHEWFQTG